MAIADAELDAVNAVEPQASEKKVTSDAIYTFVLERGGSDVLVNGIRGHIFPRFSQDHLKLVSCARPLSMQSSTSNWDS